MPRKQCRLVFAFVCALAPACSSGAPERRDRVILEDDLVTPVRETDEPVEIAQPGSPNAATFFPELEYVLTLVAEVAPPEIDGVELHATSVTFEEQRAFVTYNLAGEQQMGGIDVFTFSEDRRPRLASRATFDDTDVAAASSAGGRLWLATATAGPGFTSPAVLEGLSISPEGKLGLDFHARTALSSYAATSAVGAQGRVFVATGNTGGVFMVDPQTGERLAERPLDDARWIASPGDGTLVVVQGTPGRLTILDAQDLTVRSSYPFDGAQLPEAKSTVEIAGNKAYVAGGPGGTFVFDLASGEQIARIPLPVVPQVKQADIVSNAVSVDGSLMFISNGSAGLTMVQLSAPVSAPHDPDSFIDYATVGRLVFTIGVASANHIVYRDGFLFIATGRGGLKIVRVDSRPRECDPGFWGPTCSDPCAAAGCAAGLLCDKASGARVACETCSAGYYGALCEGVCQVEGCALGAVCDQASGLATGCAACEVGRWGPTCEQLCDPGQCVGVASCDQVTGARTACDGCSPGYHGPTCDATCAQGTCDGTVVCDQQSGSTLECKRCLTGRVGSVELGALPNYLFFFAEAEDEAKWQGISKGYAGDVAIDGILAEERTSGKVPFAGTIFTNDSTLSDWQDIVDEDMNAGQAFARLTEIARIEGLRAALLDAFDQVDALAATEGFASRSAASLHGLDTRNGHADTTVINVTSGFSISSKIEIAGDADDTFVLRWDEDANPANGYQGGVSFMNGGAIVPKGELTPGSFVHVAGDISAAGGGSTPPAPYPAGPRLDRGMGPLVAGGSDFDGGGFFTGFWLTTGRPKDGQTGSLSHAIFVGGWYSLTNKFSMSGGASGVHVCPAGED